MAKSIDEAEKESGTGSGHRMRDKIFDDQGNAKENAAAIMALETGQGPDGLNFAGLGGKVDRSNKLLERIEETLSKIAGSFALRSELKAQGERAQTAQSDLTAKSQLVTSAREESIETYKDIKPEDYDKTLMNRKNDDGETRDELVTAWTERVTGRDLSKGSAKENEPAIYASMEKVADIILGTKGQITPVRGSS